MLSGKSNEIPSQECEPAGVLPSNGGPGCPPCDAGQGAGRTLGTRDAVASLKDITAKGLLTLKNVIVLGNPFGFTKDNIDQFDFLAAGTAGNDAGHAQGVRRRNGRRTVQHCDRQLIVFDQI